MKTIKVVKSSSSEEERMFIRPPYTVISTPHIGNSQSILLRVGGIREMIRGLGEEDSLRIEWFCGDKPTEFSFFKELT